jgi:hypothetical protein
MVLQTLLGYIACHTQAMPLKWSSLYGCISSPNATLVDEAAYACRNAKLQLRGQQFHGPDGLQNYWNSGMAISWCTLGTFYMTGFCAT